MRSTRSTIIAISCIASLDAALGSAEQKARAANQNSLFGDDEAHAMPVQMAEVPRWKMREQLAQEKTALGFYLSGHPYQEFAEELSNFVKHKLADITPDIVAPASGNGIMAGGGGRRNNAKSAGAGRHGQRCAHPADAARQDGGGDAGRRQRTHLK